MKLPTVWLTGLPGAGKTTMADMLKEYCQRNEIPAVIFDGDELRTTLSQDLPYTDDGRKEHNRRVITVAKILAQHDILGIISLVSPFRESRELARKEIPNFVEVYVKASLDTCIKRDPKGLYQKAKEGKIKNMTGITSPYEEPKNPEITLDTEKNTPQESLDILIQKLEDLGYLK
jgi:adenylylsulfate kinase